MSNQHLYEFYVDVRNGRVVDSIDNEPAEMAPSIADLLNEVARHQEAGRIVANDWDSGSGNEGIKILNAFDLRAYERME